MLRRTIALVLAASLAGSGCASAVRPHVAVSALDDSMLRDEISEYARHLPIGSRVRVERSQGGTVKGTLMSATAGHVIVQRATRIPEPPIEIPLDNVTRIELERPSNIAKIVLFGAAAGAVATLGFLAILAAALAD